MPIEPLEVHEFARDIAKRHPTEEVALRSAVSRLYYGVYLHARDRLGVAQRRRSHQEVRNELQRRTRKVTGDQLGDLRQLREEADYDLKSGGWEQNFMRATRLADRVLKDLRKRVR